MNANPDERIPSDSELLDAIRQGDEEAAERLCIKHDPELLVVIASFLAKNGCHPSREHAKGVKSNVWINIFRYLNRLDDVNRFTAWRDEIARNEARNHLKRCITRQNSLLELEDESSLPDGRISNLDKVTENAELVERLLKDAEIISPKLAQIIWLLYAEECSWDEISERLGENKAALHTFYYRKLIKLKKKWGGRGG